MGKDETKEDSGFGFKDKAKAEETLRLLESHEPQYRRLTVRGLLGRAKRVLSLTKAEEKIKNIKEAMAVFEEWLEQLDKDKKSDGKKSDDKKSDGKKTGDKKSEDKKSDKRNSEDKEKKTKKDDSSDSSGDVEMEDKEEKKDKSPPPDGSVPGLGFKDAAAARGTLQALEGRDPDYQKLAVKGLIGRARRVLTCTKDESKVNNINEALVILEKFVDEFESQHRSADNNAYLPLAVVEGCYRLATARQLSLDAYRGFVEAYRGARGEYKRLRTVAGEGGVTWDVLRNKALADLKKKHAEAKLYDAAGDPSDAHVHLILWAYSPEPARVKRIPFAPAPESPEAGAEAGAAEGRKRRSSGGGDAAGKRRRE